MDTMITVAIDAAKAAGDSILLAANDLPALNVEQKTPHDYVSEVDRNAEKIVTTFINSSFPEHKILGEEYGSQGGESNEYTWVIDPLDGTTNFLRAIGHYAVSIAVLKDSIVEHAVIYDPCKNDLFTASRGQGAFLNGRKLNVSSATSIEGGLLSTGVPFSGENLNLQKWDIAAGVLLVTEAGGVVTDFAGEQSYLDSGNVVAAPCGVHSEMLAIIEDCYGDTCLSK